MSETFSATQDIAARWRDLVSTIPDERTLDAVLAAFRLGELASEAVDNWSDDPEYNYEYYRKIYSQLNEIVDYYYVNEHYYVRQKSISLTEHKKNLGAIVRYAKGLRSALGQDMLLVSLSMPNFRSNNAIRRKDFNPELASNILEKLEVEAAFLLDNEQALRRERRGVDKRWSPERALIWQPYFELLRFRLGKVPASRDGPVMRGLEALHRAIAARHEIEMPIPAVEGVYEAIQDFNSQGADDA
jgi:hypothetical protein